MKYPKLVENLILEFKKLPSVGPKTAERYVIHLLKQDKTKLIRFSDLLKKLSLTITLCENCFNISENKICPICSDKTRDTSQVCIVAKPQDLLIIENTNTFKGIYHVLWGNINAISGINPEQLKINELIKRIEKNKNIIKEVILAFDLDMQGETTLLYLLNLLKKYNIKKSKLARGMPTGSEIEYADDITLSNAFKARTEIK